MRYVLLSAVLCGLAASYSFSAHAQSPSATQPRDAAPEPAAPLSAAEQRHIDRRWNREWRDIAKHFVAFEGRYYCFPNYSPDRPSSHPMTPEEYIRHTAYEITYRTLKSDDNRFVVTKPLEDAQAATILLLDPRPGAYGYIHSGLVVDNIQDGEIILTAVHLIDWEAVMAVNDAHIAWVSEQISNLLPRNLRDEQDRFRLSLRESLFEANVFRKADRWIANHKQEENKFATREWRIFKFENGNSSIGRRWPLEGQASGGVQLAILFSDGNQVTAIPSDHIGKDISELDLLNALEQFGYSKQDFVELVEATRREHRDDYIQRVLEAVTAQDADATDTNPQDADAQDYPTE